MITTKQKWILGVSFAVSAGIWTPQLIERASSDTHGQMALDGPTEAEMLESEAVMEEMEFINNGGEPGRESASASEHRPGDVDGPDAIVGSILGALGTSEVFSGNARHRTLREIADDWARESGGGIEEHRTPLVAFLDDNPFNGTMTGPSRRLAMFGAYTLHEGDEIPRTGMVVTSIQRDGVVLEGGGATIEIELPPLRASTQYARERMVQRRRQSPQMDETVLPLEGDDL